jgi:hypothetical protein
MNKSSFQKFLTACQIIGVLLLFTGCVLFQTPEQRIPERKTFSDSFIKQDSYTVLKNSYIKHFNLVSDELHRLERLYQESGEKPAWLVQKIESHKKYLADMAAYPFLCPSHDVSFIVNGEKQCPSCRGKGKRFWGKPCPTCSGQGIITYQSKQNRRCPYCKQFYRGSILGGSLYENK